MSKSNLRLAKTILISGLSVVISYAINFLLTPYITDMLGIEAYSFVSISKTAVSYAGIITISLTSFIVRFISVSYHENKLEDARSYYSSSIVASAVLTLVIFGLAFIAIWNLDHILNIPQELVFSVKLLFVIVFINFIISTVTTPFSSAAYIKNRLDITGIVKIAAFVCDAIVLILLFTNFTPCLWYVGIGSLTASLLTMICSVLMTKRYTPNLYFEKKSVSLKKVKDIMRNGIWNSFNSLGNTLNSGLDLLISNLMLSGTATGQIAVVKTINVMFSTLYQVVFQPFQPQLIKAYASGNLSAFLEQLKKCMKICGYFSNVAFAGFFSLGMLYYRLWLPQQDTQMLYELTIITILASITAGVMQPVYYVNTLTLKNKLPCWITISGGILNVISMYLMLKYTSLGAFAVVGTTTFIMLAINLLFNPIYSAKCLKINPLILYKVIFRHILSAILMTTIFWFVAKILAPTSWIGLILCGLLFCVMGLFVHIVTMCSNKEIKKICNKFKK